MPPHGIRCLVVVALVLPLTLIALFTPSAWACPFCDGGPSGTNEVKEAIFGENFWWHVFCTVAPFGVFLGIAALVHFGIPLGRQSPTAVDSPEADPTGPTPATEEE